MLCQNCKKREASVNHAETVGGKPVFVHLCAFCAQELFGDFEKSFADGVEAGLFDEPGREEKVCPFCGMEFSEFRRTGLLGCPSCYDVFNEELLPYITKIQGKAEHVGKAGGEHTKTQDVQRRLAALQEKMEDALGRGDYVEAGKINEQMNAIKKRASGGWRW